MLKRFTRNGPNSTLQIDDNKNIVSTPDGKIDQSKNTFLVILCLGFPEFQFNKSQFVFECENLKCDSQIEEEQNECFKSQKPES